MSIRRIRLGPVVTTLLISSVHELAHHPHMLARLGARLGQVVLRSGKSFGRLATFGAGIAVGTEADSLKKHGPYEVVIKRRSGALPPAAAPEASSAAASSWGWSRSAVAGEGARAGRSCCASWHPTAAV